MAIRRCIPIALTVACFAVFAACAPAPADPALSPAVTVGLPGEASATPTMVFTRPPLPTLFRTRTKSPVPTKTPNPTWTSSPTIPEETQFAGLVGMDLLPPGARLRLGKGRINQVAVSPDGGAIAVAGELGVSLFRTNTFEEVWSVTTTQKQGFISFSPDGRTITSMNINKYDRDIFTTNIEVGPANQWNASDGSVRKILDIRGYGENKFGLAFSPDKSLLAMMSGEFAIDLWNLKDGKLSYSLKAPLHNINCLAFSEDGKMLAAGGSGEVALWNLGTQAMLWEKELPEGEVGRIAFSPDGKSLAVSSGKAVFLWDVGEESDPFALEGSAGNVVQIAFTPDGNSLVAGDDEGNVFQWALRDGRFLPLLEHTGGPVNSIAFLKDGKEILVGSADGVQVWDADAGHRSGSLVDVFSRWEKAGFLPGGKEIALATSGKINFIHPVTAALRRTVEYPFSAVLSADYRLYALLAEDGKIHFADTGSGAILYAWTAPEYLLEANGEKIFFSPDGNSFAMIRSHASPDGGRSAELWDLQSGKRLRSMEYPYYGSSDRLFLDFSPTGRFVALGIADWEYGSAFYVYDTTSGEKVFAAGRGYFLEITPDEKAVLSPCDGEAGYCLDDLISHDRLQMFPWRIEGYATAARFSPNGKVLAFGTSVGQIILVDVETGGDLRLFEGFNGPVESLAFSPDGKTLISAGDGSVVLWNANA
jgi:WD40 repeat protein